MSCTKTLTVRHTTTCFFFLKPYPINAPSRAPTQDLALLLGGRLVLMPCSLVVDCMPGNTIQQTAAATARMGEPSGDGVAVHGTHASGAQNSSSVHGTQARGAQNSSAVHRTRPLCTEPTPAVHRTRPLCTEPKPAVHRTRPQCTELTSVKRPLCTELILCAQNCQ